MTAKRNRAVRGGGALVARAMLQVALLRNSGATIRAPHVGD
jgi:hypothetical protein